jgi:hypothetical protein
VSYDYTEKVELVGIYNVETFKEVKLIELIIKGDINDFDPGLITQEIREKDRLDWQTAYDEKYLDLNGTEIIGDDLNKPKDYNKFRVAFLFDYLQINKPLISQYGLIKLTRAINVPDRLKELINYESID